MINIQRFELRPANAALGLIIVLYFFIGICYINTQSVTSDESSFYNYAVRLLKGNPQRSFPGVDNSKMPVSVINLTPRVVMQIMHPNMEKTDNGESDIFAGRYITLLISLFTIFLAFYWSRELYGEWAGVLSACMVGLCPNLLANAGLVTTDSYSALFLTATIYWLWRFIKAGSYTNFILFCLLIACSQHVKQSLIWLYLIALVLLIISFFVYKPHLTLKKIVIYVSSFIFLNWLIINMGYFFRESGTAIGDYHFVSNTFIHLQQIFPGRMPLPFPKAFVYGLDYSKYYDQIGGGNFIESTFGNVTILGRSSAGGSFWYYYIISFLFKTPVSYLILFGMSLWLIIRKRTMREFLKNEFFLIAPIIFYGVYMSLFYKTQIGIRQFIFVYPPLYILSGSVVNWLKPSRISILITVLGLLHIFTFISYRRNYYSYTNEFITDKKMAYRIVGASNLEFHQSQFFFNQFLLKHPEVKLAPKTPENGVFLISVNDYLDIWNQHEYDWIKRYPPTGDVVCNGLLITVNDAK